MLGYSYSHQTSFIFCGYITTRQRVLTWYLVLPNTSYQVPALLPYIHIILMYTTYVQQILLIPSFTGTRSYQVYS